MYYYYVLYLLDLVRGIIGSMYSCNMTISDFELGSERLDEEIFNFLESRIYEVSHVHVLVLCNKHCIEELLHQVSVDFHSSGSSGRVGGRET